MTSKKSIFKRVCSCLLAMSFIAAPVFAEETKSDDRALLQVEFLEALGVYDSDNIMMTQTQEYLTRENLAVILGGFFGIEPTAPVGANNETGFLDIEPDHWAAERIQAVADRKIMTGYSDGYFRPQNNATYEQAVKTLVVLAGHDISADFNGGWSTGYMSVANELGITDGVSLGLTEPIRKGQFTQMLVNLLDAEMLKVRFSAMGEIYYEQTDKIFMNEVLGIYTQKGVMTANDQTSLLGKNPASKGFITIDGINIKADNQYSDYLGSNVVAYYKYDADENLGELLWIEEGKRNSVLEIKGEDIINPNSSGYFEYEVGTNVNRVRIAEILSLSVIYNGKLRKFATYNDLAPKNGTVKLIDAQNDGVFETALVWNYYDYYVDSIYQQDDIITIVDKRGEVAVLKIKLADNYSLDITSDGNKVELSTITSGSILSVAADSFTQDKIDTVKTAGAPIEIESSFVKMISTKNSVVGTLKATSSKSYTIDGTVYEFSPYFDTEAEQVFMGVGLTAYLNYDGKIVCVDMNDGWNYGFVKKAVWLEENETCLIRIYTSDGEFVDYEVNKLTIDGDIRKDNLIIEDLNTSGKEYQTRTGMSSANKADYHQMIKYFIKNKKLVEIDTVMPNSDEEDEDENKKSFFISKVIPKETEAEIGSGNARVVGTDSNKSTATEDDDMEMYLFPTTAKYFIIPEDMNNTNDFAMWNISSDRKNSNQKVLFDGDDMNVIPLVVEYGANAESVATRSSNNYDMVFKEKIYELNADGEATYILKGVHLATGNDIEVELENEDVYDIYLNDDLKLGDIVSWNQNIRGKATMILRVYSPATGLDSNVASGLRPTKFATGNNIFAGTVINRRDNFLKIRDSLTGKSYIPDEILANFDSSGIVLVVESDTKTVRKGTLAEINTEARYGRGNADKIYLRYQLTRPMRLVIYK